MFRSVRHHSSLIAHQRRSLHSRRRRSVLRQTPRQTPRLLLYKCHFNYKHNYSTVTTTAAAATAAATITTSSRVSASTTTITTTTPTTTIHKNAQKLCHNASCNLVFHHNFTMIRCRPCRCQIGRFPCFLYHGASTVEQYTCMNVAVWIGF